MNDDPIERRRRQRQSRERMRLAIAIGAVGMLLAVAIMAVVVASMKRRKGEPEVAAPPPRFVPPPPVVNPPPQNQPVYLLDMNTNNVTFKTGNEAKYLQYGYFKRDFDENELKAMKTYQGVRFYVMGRVADLQVLGEETSLTLGHPGFYAVNCNVHSGDPLLLKIRAGDRENYPASMVMLEGTCRNLGTFEACRVVEVK